MFDSKKLGEILSEHKQVMAKLEQTADAIIKSDLTRENEELKKSQQQIQQLLAEKDEKLKNISGQNRELRNALFEQIYSEKTTMLSNSKIRSDIYFKRGVNEEINRLTQLEKSLQSRTHIVKAALQKHTTETNLVTELNELSKKAAQVITQAKAEAEKARFEQAAYSEEQFNILKNEQITDEQIIAIGKKNNLEAFVGGNLINKVGIVFIILGIITLSRFGFFMMPNWGRALIMVAISLLFLAGGEFFNRRRPTIFSLGLTSAGVAGLYASLVISFFMFGIIGMIPALLLCIFITVGAFTLSLRYNSQTIATFALVGGYLPIAAIFDNSALVYSAMAYFAILNLFALSVSFYKKWKISMFVGFSFNLIGTFFILVGLDSLWNRNALMAVLYVAFVFAIYTAVPILSNYRTKQAFSTADVVLLSLNTVFSSLIMYGTLLAFNLDGFMGAMAVAFALVYIALWRVMERLFAREKHIAGLFFLTGVTFAVLFVPMQFDMMWLSLGWLVQGVGMACYGIIRGHGRIKIAGYVVFGLCLLAFIAVDIEFMDRLFPYRYLAITMGSTLILASLIYKKSVMHELERAYKYVVLINVWAYSLYLVYQGSDFIIRILAGTVFNPWYLINAILLAVTFLYAFALPRLPYVADYGTRIMSVCLASFGMLTLLVHTGYSSATHYYNPPISIMLITTVVIVALCVLSLLAMRSVLQFFVMEGKLSVEWLPFGISAYFLVLLTHNLVVQYNMSVTSMVLSIIFVVAALLWIIFGFVRRFVFMRRFGLGLAVIAVAKLFLVDFQGLTDGNLVVSYFAFGLTLLGISFVYQHFSKRFALKLDKNDE